MSLLAICSPADTTALTATAQWDRETDPSVTSYNIYVCKTKHCVLALGASSTVLAGSIPQPSSGTSVEFSLTTGWQGALAVTAVNAAGESALSASVPVDTLAPGAATDFSNP